MIRFCGLGILLDIEGTTASLAYVRDVLFPYARRELRAFLQKRWNSPEIADVREQIAAGAGAATFEDWMAAMNADGQELLAGEVNRLMDADMKSAGLKELQGLIWEEGFRSGLLRSHLFADVAPVLAAWAEAGLDVRIFSSGSVHAQKLYFRHAEAGDLRLYLRGYYDTTTGSKRSAVSYTAIVRDMGFTPEAVLFLSDIVEELDAAREAGLNTGLVIRPGNAPVLDSGHPVIRSLEEVEFGKTKDKDESLAIDPSRER